VQPQSNNIGYGVSSHFTVLRSNITDPKHSPQPLVHNDGTSSRGSEKLNSQHLRLRQSSSRSHASPSKEIQDKLIAGAAHCVEGVDVYNYDWSSILLCFKYSSTIHHRYCTFGNNVLLLNCWGSTEFLHTTVKVGFQLVKQDKIKAILQISLSSVSDT
jgi:hypothetical protein